MSVRIDFLDSVLEGLPDYLQSCPSFVWTLWVLLLKSFKIFSDLSEILSGLFGIRSRHLSGQSSGVYH